MPLSQPLGTLTPLHRMWRAVDINRAESYVASSYFRVSMIVHVRTFRSIPLIQDFPTERTPPLPPPFCKE